MLVKININFHVNYKLMMRVMVIVIIVTILSLPVIGCHYPLHFINAKPWLRKITHLFPRTS